MHAGALFNEIIVANYKTLLEPDFQYLLFMYQLHVINLSFNSIATHLFIYLFSLCSFVNIETTTSEVISTVYGLSITVTAINKMCDT